MSVAADSRRAWLVLAFGNERQYAGNAGYDDELTEICRYDSNVGNWKRVAKNDLLLLRDRERLIGVARVHHVESYPATKWLRRCPVCRTTNIKERQRREPRFRCSDGHEFREPMVDTVRCTKLEAKFGGFRSASRDVPIGELRRACPKYTDQLSIQRIELKELAEGLHRAVPGFGTILAEEPLTEEVGDNISPEAASDSAPSVGELGIPYRRPNEESLGRFARSVCDRLGDR